MTEKSIKRVSAAAGNMCVLIDDVIKKARKNFRETGKPDIDPRFIKESVSALKELYTLLGDYEGGEVSDGVIVKIEKQLEEWSK